MMSRQCSYRCFTMGAWLGLASCIALAAPAARVEFAAGNVSATSQTGQMRALAKGAEVDSGDTVNTRDGRVQLRFTDGAYISLQSQTLFRIDDYRYDGKSDGSERGFFSLLKGGLRTITGLVGRTNRRNYQINTTVATIGIRGTEYTLAYGNSVSGSVGEGQIDVCNGGGCLPVGSGQSFYVAASDVKPEITSKKTDLPPSPPTGSAPTFISGDQTTENGTPKWLLLTGSQILSVVTGGTPGFLSEAPVILNAQGAVTQIDLTPSPATNGPQLLTLTTTAPEPGNDGIIVWGSGSALLQGSPHYIHYIAGLPTPLTDMTTLRATSTIASYTLVGGSAPTADVDGVKAFQTGTLSPPELTGLTTLTADFGRGQVDASVAFAMSGLKFQAKGQMAISGNMFSNPQSGSGTSCMVSSGACSVAFMAGFFAGPGAIRAGLVYDVSTRAVVPKSCDGGASVCSNLPATSIKGTAAFAKAQ